MSNKTQRQRLPGRRALRAGGQVAPQPPSAVVISDVFELVKTIEFDVEVGGRFLPTRVEVLRDTQRPRRFRCHLWELEYCHVEGTFAAGPKGKARRPVSDEPILVERTWEMSSRFHDFEAASANAALQQFLQLLRKRMENGVAQGPAPPAGK